MAGKKLPVKCDVAVHCNCAPRLIYFGALFSTWVLISRHVTRLHMARSKLPQILILAGGNLPVGNETRRIYLNMLRVKGTASSI
jgi:hypothetical protein